MKYIMCSRVFPKGHPRQGESTHFVEKIWNSFRRDDFSLPDSFAPWVKNFPFKSEEYLQAIGKASIRDCKLHTIRAGSRYKPGETVSLRVWSGSPYRSKQIEFAQVEVKKVWSIEIGEFWFINDAILEHDQVTELASNDGLVYDDFINWFKIHPKKQGEVFSGQIICWSSEIEYSKPELVTEKENND